MLMRIREFIQNQILTRLRQHEVLLVYDQDGRYRDLCLSLDSDKIQVIDASESSLASRREALAAFSRLGEPNSDLEGLLVYVPAKAPLTDEEKQRDPFALYGACGAVFPDPNNDGDKYQSLCLKAMPDQVTEIRRIFANDPNPPFAVIDAISGEDGWPTLKALLGVQSAHEILFALLSPENNRREALEAQTTWIPEAKTLLQQALGMKLLTKVKSWAAVADELWRFLLFSEFVFDVPGELPTSLVDVPCAPPDAQTLVYDLCDSLRNDLRTQPVYIERAEEIQQTLDLLRHCQSIDDFGERDTFPFEERASFQKAVHALRADDVDLLRRVLQRHERSVWVARGENAAQWGLLRAAAALIQAVDDAERELPGHIQSLEALVTFYTASLREVDRYHREFEQAAGDIFGDGPGISDLKTQARLAYNRLATELQRIFLKHVEKDGWPLANLLANRDAFDQLIAPALQESGRRVALLLIDAMRYELGVELSKQLGDFGQVEVQAACAQLPTITPVGMASLLPGASGALHLQNKNSRLVIGWNGQSLTNVNQRMEIMRNWYGQRFAEMDLGRFVQSRAKLDPAVELLVLRSNEMDNDFETNPEAAPSLISRTFQKVGAALHKLLQMGFDEAFLMTDHGFYLNTALEAGDVCAPPPGNWVTVHDRILLGDGNEDAANLVLPTERLGIPGEFSQAAIPRALVAYRAGQVYLHGGLSLQEALVPVINVRMRQPAEKAARKPEIVLAYKRGTGKITTRLPVIEISTGQPQMFAEDIEIVIEAHDEKGDVVGEAKPGGVVNPATRIITMKPGEKAQVTLKMDLHFEGIFFVKALDPNTMAALGKALELETDYTV
jgi:hypothetical protein